jgi:hypothetical protein
MPEPLRARFGGAKLERVYRLDESAARRSMQQAIGRVMAPPGVVAVIHKVFARSVVNSGDTPRLLSAVPLTRSSD